MPTAAARPAALLLLGALALCLVVPGAQGGEGEPAPAAMWVLDVRVVRVDPADPSVVETRPEWEPAGPEGPATSLAWPDLLGRLKSRGRTTLLLDQRLTTLPGVPAEANLTRIRAVRTFERKDVNNETWRSGTVETGARAKLLPGPAGLSYSVDVRWEHPVAGGSDEVATQASASWQGTSAHPSGTTLVLSHRQQDGGTGVEVYVFVTGWSGR